MKKRLSLCQKLKVISAAVHESSKDVVGKLMELQGVISASETSFEDVE